jgi:dTDP-4-dehydrorhamnose 3,5-epimerase
MSIPVEFESTEIEGIQIIKTRLLKDSRGFFTELYVKKAWAESGFAADFVQDNLSLSMKGTLRGMHYQIHPHGMGKLVRCLRGAVYDVAVDLRRGSPTFGRWVGRELSEDNAWAMWVPVGFAHGFIALADNSLVLYKCTGQYAPECERSLNFACPKVGIDWPAAPEIITDKDKQAPMLGDAEYNFEYQA